MRVTLNKHKDNTPVVATLKLPENKSISNRLMIISALSGNFPPPGYHPTTDDSRLMYRHLQSFFGGHQDYFCDNAGTVLRFLAPFLAFQGGRFILHGSERMHKRPLSGLDRLLIQLGAEVHALERAGYPPISIVSNGLKGDKVEVTAYESGQPVSGILMLAPLLSNGLKVVYEKPLPGFPYIEMTLQMMNRSGIRTETSDSGITVFPGVYNTKNLQPEPDWSAAAFWYELVSLLPRGSKINLPRLPLSSSIQGDKYAATLFEGLGVTTMTDGDGISIVKARNPQSAIRASFFDHPDLFPAFATACAALGVSAELTGLQNLKHKESDRIQAIVDQLAAYGFRIANDADTHTVRISPGTLPQDQHMHFERFKDHRLAMALARLAALYKIRIENADAVSKSYPQYWEEMAKTGIITETNE